MRLRGGKCLVLDIVLEVVHGDSEEELRGWEGKRERYAFGWRRSTPTEERQPKTPTTRPRDWKDKPHTEEIIENRKAFQNEDISRCTLYTLMMIDRWITTPVIIVYCCLLQFYPRRSVQSSTTASPDLLQDAHNLVPRRGGDGGSGAR